ncbi:hypothetical protein BH23PLA1_BH23PLA1_00740 [soil metagenome]
MARWHDPIARRLIEAEGYLELGLPQAALEILQGRPEWATMQFEAHYLTGETLRILDRCRDALRSLEAADALRPGRPEVAMALGWCYKRTHRLAQAIDALDRARVRHPDNPLLCYNLACYWSLAGNVSKALDELTLALELQPSLFHLIPEEADFNPIRQHPDFNRLTSQHAPQV